MAIDFVQSASDINLKAISYLSELERNIALAKEAIDEVRSYLTVGTNTEKDCKDVLECDDLIKKMRKEVSDEGCAYADTHGGFAGFDVTANLYTAAVKKYGYGQCMELASSVIVNLKNKGVSSLSYCITTKGQHALAVIGIDKDADFNNIATWGENAVVCDAWAEKIYPVSDFQTMQLPEHDVRLPSIVYIFNPNCPHYLAGNLKVMHHYTAENGFVDVNLK